MIALPEIVSPTTQAANRGLSAVSPKMRSAVSGLGNRRPPKVMSAIAVGRMIRPSKSKNARSLEDTAALEWVLDKLKDYNTNAEFFESMKRK